MKISDKLHVFNNPIPYCGRSVNKIECLLEQIPEFFRSQKSEFDSWKMKDVGYIALDDLQYNIAELKPKAYFN